MNYLVNTREFATSVAVPEGAGAGDAVETTFADGTTGEIIEFMCGDSWRCWSRVACLIVVKRSAIESTASGSQSSVLTLAVLTALRARIDWDSAMTSSAP
eukprot:11164598-Heterocapsa_arctica.AAC.1